MGGELPDGWNFLRLAECVERIVSGATPRARDPRYYGAGTIPFARIEDVVAARGGSIVRTKLAITEDAVRETAAKVYPTGTVLMTMYGTIGTVAMTGCPMAANQAIAAFLGPKIDSRFLLHLLMQEAPRLARLAGQTTQANISGQILKRYVVIVPKERTEQQWIAWTLDTIDDAIEKTEAVIAATENLRKALLQELLTRGVPGWHTEWKMVAGIGEIPACWEVVRLGGCLIDSVYGPRFSAERYDENGNVATLRTTDINDEGDIDLDSMPRATLNLEPFRSFLLQADDLVITRSGSCGIAAIFDGHYLPVLPGAFLIRLRTALGSSPQYLKLWLNSPPGREATGRIQAGGVQKNINAENLKRLLFPRPCPEEQARILEIVAEIREREVADSVLLSFFRELKAELANALLSGTIRVPQSSGVAE